MTIIPEVMELDCTSIVNSALTRNARIGLSRVEKKRITSGFVLSGSTVEESKEREKRMKPRKKIGLLISFAFLPNRPKRKPRIIKKDASRVELSTANCAVTVVPMLLPSIIPKLLLKEMIPVFTSITVVTVTAELECITAVDNAPTSVPRYLFLANLPITDLNLSEANSCISLLRFSMA